MATRPVGLAVAYTASLLSALLVVFPLKSTYSDCDKAAKLLLMSPGKPLDKEVRALLTGIVIPCTINPLLQCLTTNP